MTQLPPGGGEESRTGRTLAALEKLGFTQRDRMRLRFSFEAATLHQAVALASELRTIAGSVVQVRPGQALLRVKRRWNVTLSTPPTALAPAAIHRWESELGSVARRHTGCSLVGWEPLLDARHVNRIVSGSGGRPT